MEVVTLIFIFKVIGLDEDMLKKNSKNDIRCGMVTNTFENNVELIKFENIKLEEMKNFKIT